MAVPVADEMRHRIVAQLGDVVIPGKVNPPHKWHLTLRFLGPVDDITYDKLQAALDEADLGGAFHVSWGGLGAFPKPGRATVLWLAVERGSDGLRSLAARVEAALARAGVPAEDRPFRPHLTLSRIRPPQDVSRLVSAVKPLGGRMRVGAVEMVESHLRGSRGSEYEVLERFELG